jgi:hypothetical protein
MPHRRLRFKVRDLMMLVIVIALLTSLIARREKYGGKSRECSAESKLILARLNGTVLTSPATLPPIPRGPKMRGFDLDDRLTTLSPTEHALAYQMLADKYVRVSVSLDWAIVSIVLVSVIYIYLAYRGTFRRVRLMVLASGYGPEQSRVEYAEVSDRRRQSIRKASCEPY